MKKINFEEIDSNLKNSWLLKLFSEIQKESKLTKDQQIIGYLFIYRVYLNNKSEHYCDISSKIKNIIWNNPQLKVAVIKKIFISLWLKDLENLHEKVAKYLKKYQPTPGGIFSIYGTRISVETLTFNSNKNNKRQKNNSLRIAKDSPTIETKEYKTIDLELSKNFVDLPTIETKEYTTGKEEMGGKEVLALKKINNIAKKVMTSVKNSMIKKEFEDPIKTKFIDEFSNNNTFNYKNESDDIINKIINYFINACCFKSLNSMPPYEWNDKDLDVINYYKSLTLGLPYSKEINFTKVIEIIRIVIGENIQVIGENRWKQSKEKEVIFSEIKKELQNKEVEWNKEKYKNKRKTKKLNKVKGL